MGVFFMQKKLLCLAMALLLLAGCGPEGAGPVETPAPSPELTGVERELAAIRAMGESPDDNYRTWYEVFVYSFCDSDGDGIGDLNGVREKLPYLQELGITGIWLMPIHPSTTYHKYNVSDYYGIDPQYGTMEDFEALMAQCDELGIKVILDLVVNHTGSEHPWFREAVEYLQSLPAGAEPDPAACEYVDHYHFLPASQSKSGYSAVTGSDYCYEAQFSYDMPDLNWDSQAVRDEIRAVMKFWLDKGVAGFRLDAAKEFFSGDPDKNIEVLSWLQQTAVDLKPDCYLVAEVWSDSGTITKYYASGITSIFDYPFGDSSGSIVRALRGAGQEAQVGNFAKMLERLDKAYREQNPDYIDAPFLSNHDVGRIAGFVTTRDVGKVKLAGAMNLFMGGSAFIYYGEEIGMVGSGNDPSKRAPMYWNAERNDGTTDPPPDCTLPDSYPLGSLAQQREDEGSVYNYYRKAIAIRNALPVISHGAVTCEEALNKGSISAQRKSWNGQACILLMNVDSKENGIDLSAYADWELKVSLEAGEEKASLEGTTLTLPAWAVAVLTPQKG